LNKTIASLPVNEPIFEAPIANEVVAETPIVDIDAVAPKIVFTLEDVEETVFEIHEPVATMDLVPTTEFLKNIAVTYEVVAAPATANFEIITPQIREIKVNDPEFVKANDDFNFELDLFDINLDKAANTSLKNTIVFDLSDETRSLEVKDPINVVPVTEINQNGIIKYSLEDYLEQENAVEATNEVHLVNEPIDEELNFTLKNDFQKLENNIHFDAVSPLEMSIEETLKFRAEERKRKMKEFNHKFNNNSSQIDEFEREPAYKRMGIDLTTPLSGNNNQSRMSLGTDSNDDIQLRSNNSFLHDNVD
jgi:cell division protein FtsZ